jgi:hypothetical protein
VRREQPDRAHVQGPLGEKVEHDRKLSAQPSRLDAVVGRVLGEPKDTRAVGEERSVALAQVELARVELGEVADELDRGLPFSAGEYGHAVKEIGIGESGRGGNQSMVHVVLQRTVISDVLA